MLLPARPWRWVLGRWRHYEAVGTGIRHERMGLVDAGVLGGLGGLTFVLGGALLVASGTVNNWSWCPGGKRTRRESDAGTADATSATASSV